MKIAVPVKNNAVDDHFGHSEYFKIFEIEENKIKSSKNIKTTGGCGCKSNLVSELQQEGIDVMLAGNLGQGAYNKLTTAKIKVIRGCSGTIENVINDYLEGKIQDKIIICHEHKDDSCSHT